MSESAARLEAALDRLLPQTQCERCGYEGCRPYARAMAAGQAAPNRCPPGGELTLQALRSELGIATTDGPRSVDPQCGTAQLWSVARIDEQVCIGCVLCIRACPVDAIVGGPKRLHTVVAAQCTGCELCIAPCPVDCIEMVPGQPASGQAAGEEVAIWSRWMEARSADARGRAEARRARLARNADRRKASARERRPSAGRTGLSGNQEAPSEDRLVPADARSEREARMQRTIDAALARVAARRTPVTGKPDSPEEQNA